MTVLPDHMLLYMGSDLVEPFDSEMVQPASIDLCLGEEFIVFDAHEQVCIDLDNPTDGSGRKVRRTPEQGFVLHPGEFILAVTNESIKLPNNIMARLEGKSSIGRLGIMIHVTAGFVDPGWEGPLTLEVANLRKIPIILRPHKPFCQISFHYMFSAVSKPYTGRYQNAQGVEASKYGLVQEFTGNYVDPKTFTVPDESGMGEEERTIGLAYYDPDEQKWMIPMDRFRSRPATAVEVAELGESS